MRLNGAKDGEMYCVRSIVRMLPLQRDVVCRLLLNLITTIARRPGTLRLVEPDAYGDAGPDGGRLTEVGGSGTSR